MAAASTAVKHLLVLAVWIFALSMHGAEAQEECSGSLTNLTACAPFVVPGGSATPNLQPNTQCCSALSSIDHQCLCNTLRIVARLPNQCGLPAVSCTGKNTNASAGL